MFERSSQSSTRDGARANSLPRQCLRLAMCVTAATTPRVQIKRALRVGQVSLLYTRLPLDRSKMEKARKNLQSGSELTFLYLLPFIELAYKTMPMNKTCCTMVVTPASKTVQPGLNALPEIKRCRCAPAQKMGLEPLRTC